MRITRFKRGVVNTVSALFFPIKIIGKENLPEGGAVVVCNHLSFVDPLYLAKLNVREDYTIIAKKELFKNKFFGNILRKYGGISIDRENPELKTLLAVIKNLKKGEKLLLFPEGTRNKSGTINLQPIKGGTAIFAVRAKAPIVPVMIYKKARLFSRNILIVGKPFELSNFYDKKCTEEDYTLMDKIIFEKMVEEQNNLFAMLKKK